MRSIILYILISLPGLAASQKTQLMELSGKWKFTIGDREEYKDLDYDDSRWEAIRIGTPWENEGFANYNGFAWYRYEFDGAELEGFTNLLIYLGYIDDVHEAYFNGTLIGFKGSFPPDFYTAYNALNEYSIPPGIVNYSGKNVVAIKVYDVYRDGGMVKGIPEIYFEIEFSDDFYSLEGVRKFSRKRRESWKRQYYDDEDWDHIVVPSHWRSKHIKRGEGLGWYRKEFTVPASLRDKDIYLVLGKIDDFDYTYVNGQLVGYTKDFQSFGESTSWDQLRVYKLCKEILDPEGVNVIAVEVEDIGVDAGIYEGPIGLTESIKSKEQKR
ncbi:MAG: beta galactosidase jelly roll domain-containing protein [Ekhidna sp.]|nr:beta galactosidase jelly roll domain-containing protein [Ekhidna sp.]